MRAGNRRALAVRDGRCRTNGVEYANAGRCPIRAKSIGNCTKSGAVFVPCFYLSRIRAGGGPRLVP